MSTPKWFPTALAGRLIRQSHGQDLIEYGVLIALVAAGVIIVMSQIGAKVPGLYEPTVTALPGGEPGPGRGGNPGNGNPGNNDPVGNPGSGAPGGSNPGGPGNPGGG
jgi:Flp pilus assembly pilin Flp